MAHAVQQPDNFLGLDPSMKGPVIISVLFHIAFLIVASTGIPFISKEHDLIATPVPVELVQIEEEAQTPKQAKPALKKTEPEKEHLKPKNMPQPQPQEIVPLPPEIVPEPPKAEPVKAPPKKPKPPKPKPTPEKPEITKKPEPKAQKDFASLLKDLTPEKPDEASNPGSGNVPDPAQTARLSERLSMSEIDALKSGLMPCWNVMAGGKNAKDQIVEIRIILNPDRTVSKATILDQVRYNRDTHFRAAAESALRALRNPRCSPLQLPLDKYDRWKTTIIEFNPSDML